MPRYSALMSRPIVLHALDPTLGESIESFHVAERWEKARPVIQNS
jgi:hypothetical protein